MDDRDPWEDTEPDDGTEEALEETSDADLDDHEDDLEDVDLEDDDVDPDPGATWVHCPYCGEAVELLLDPAGGDLQEYVEDCEVCCRPWRVEVTYDETGAPSVELFTDDE